ncbi:MAG: PEGA domain-containing protein [Patescibacteria group bacterium]|nr:PEGA domain-containing protein [Patescibacteria group bacterium]
MKKQVLISIIILFFLSVSTVILILYGKGYRFGFGEGKIGFSETGLLVATSSPNGAQVFVDGHLTTATDNTINLQPGTYTIRIYKEGYFPWEKKIKIQKEVVSKAEATLFPTNPKLEGISLNGIDNPSLDPSKTRITYVLNSQSPRKNGVYVLDMSSRPIITLQSGSTQIADDTIDTFSKAKLSWSPDGKQIIASISGESRPETVYLLQADGFNEAPQDITATLTTYQDQWENDKQEKERSRLAGLKSNLRQMISENFKVIAWSPDDTKVLYEASQSATLPIVINPRIIGADSTPEERTLTKGNIYVYDIKEDKNFRIDKGDTGLNWFPDSKHLMFVEDKKINIFEYDNSNNTTVYAGPFLDNYIFPWPNGSKLVILTDLGNPDLSPSLYTVGLK